MFNKQNHYSNKYRRRSYPKKHTGLKVFFSLLLLILIFLGAASFIIYRNIDAVFANSYKDFPQTTKADFKNSDAFTTLIIESGHNNSTDIAYAAVLASTNAKTKQTTFMNFPVFAIMPNQKTITEAYNTGGDTGVIQMVSDLVKLPINKVVQIDVNNMGTVVQATGGITMENPKAFNANGYKFQQGTVSLQTAEQVQAYLTQVDDADFDSSVKRIQNVSMELYGNIQKIARSKKLQNINYYRNILDALSTIIKSDISLNDAKEIALNYNKGIINTSKLNLHTVTENDTKIVTQEELDSVKNMFVQSMK
ncbi:LCP family protein [Streptococcaceae bacterium ESL0729]|nr:LCP family protein [Streptococcaceae bacterium ESL0729]